MKWYSVKKYKPSHDYGGNYIVRSETSHSCFYLARYESFGNKWFNVENSELLKYITHFCIPDPVEIEHEKTMSELKKLYGK